MPAVRRLLGVATVEVAARKRICHRNRTGHEILKEESLLVIKDGEGHTKNYCRQCALEIFDRAADDLADLRAQFE